LLPPLFRMHQPFIHMMQRSGDRNSCGYAGGPQPFCLILRLFLQFFAISFMYCIFSLLVNRCIDRQEMRAHAAPLFLAMKKKAQSRILCVSHGLYASG
jgi:hypothetical protein